MSMNLYKYAIWTEDITEQKEKLKNVNRYLYNRSIMLN